MATLSGTVLSDCNYIPDFIASGSKMVFENASAPTSWTKDITYNLYALRATTGTIASGGSSPFDTVFASRSIQGTVVAQTSGVTINPVASGISIATGTFGPVSTGSNATASAPHTHAYNGINSNLRAPGAASRTSRVTTTAGQTGSGQQHNHGIAATPHTHPFTNPSHTHTTSESPHTHTFTSGTAQDFRVLYRDVIIATKD